MEKQERVLAYQLATPIDQEVLSLVTGGAKQGTSSARVELTGDHNSPDIVVEI